jgi:hypothetical protein
MTLILSALTQDYVVQVSDRQLSVGGKRIEPPTNKSVIFCGHIAYGYTGQAFIENKTTELWLVDVLAGAQSQSPTQALEAIASRATDAFRRSSQLRNKRHAFVGVGFGSISNQLRPLLCVISNYTDTQDRQAGGVRDTFTYDCTMLDPRNSFYLFPAGQRLHESEVGAFIANARSVVKRADAPAMAELLVRKVREVADRTETVGKDVMITIFPKSVVPFSSIATSFEPKTLTDQATFRYRPSDDRSDIFYAPAIVCGGITHMGSQGQIF